MAFVNTDSYRYKAVLPPWGIDSYRCFSEKNPALTPSNDHFVTIVIGQRHYYPFLSNKIQFTDNNRDNYQQL